MFLENDLIGTFTFLRLLVILLIGFAPIAVTIAIKMALYRRRIAEDEASRLLPDGNSQWNAFVLAGRPQRYRLVRSVPTTFESPKPLAPSPRFAAPSQSTGADVLPPLIDFDQKESTCLANANSRGKKMAALTHN